MINRIWTGLCSLLRDDGPSSTRLINIVVAGTGAWLLYYTAKSSAGTDWPWAICFCAYLAYGAGPHVLKGYFELLKSVKGSHEAPQQAPK